MVAEVLSPSKLCLWVLVQGPCLVPLYLAQMWLTCKWYFTLLRELSVRALLWKQERGSKKKPKPDTMLHASAKITACCLISQHQGAAVKLTFGSCLRSKQPRLSGKQFWLPHPAAKIRVSEFSGVCLPSQEAAARCVLGWVSQAGRSSQQLPGRVCCMAWPRVAARRQQSPFSRCSA